MAWRWLGNVFQPIMGDRELPAGAPEAPSQARGASYRYAYYIFMKLCGRADHRSIQIIVIIVQLAE